MCIWSGCDKTNHFDATAASYFQRRDFHQGSQRQMPTQDQAQAFARNSAGRLLCDSPGEGVSRGDESSPCHCSVKVFDWETTAEQHVPVANWPAKIRQYRVHRWIHCAAGLPSVIACISRALHWRSISKVTKYNIINMLISIPKPCFPVSIFHYDGDDMRPYIANASCEPKVMPSWAVNILSPLLVHVSWRSPFGKYDLQMELVNSLIGGYPKPMSLHFGDTSCRKIQEKSRRSFSRSLF